VSLIIDPRTGSALATTGSAREWFGGFLRSKGLLVQPQSSLARALRSLEKVEAWSRGAPVPDLPVQERYEIASDAFGIDFFTKALRDSIGALDEPMRDYWPLLVKGDPNPIRAAESGTARNLLWELLVAALVAKFCTGLRRVEPDLHCTFLDRSWGLACKAFYSFAFDRQVDAIVEGAKQLESASVDRGIVIVNVANIFPHRPLFDPDFPSSEHAIHFVNRTQRAWISRFRSRRVVRRLTSGSKGSRSKTRTVLFFCPALVNIRAQPSLFCSVEALPFREVQDEEARFAMSFRKAAVLAL
jgi:hypothetical protein